MTEHTRAGGPANPKGDPGTEPPVRILHGDCREVLATLPAESVHCVVTSPPYWGLRDYGVDGQIGLEDSPEAWVAEMVEVFRAVRRVLRKDGTAWVNVGDAYAGGASGQNGQQAGTAMTGGVPESRKRGPAPGLLAKQLIGLPWRLAFALQADGWWLRSDIIWSKPNPMPESCTDRPTKAHEHVFLLSKSARYYYDQEAVREAAEYGRRDQPADTWNRCKVDGERVSGATSGANTAAGRNIRDVWTIATQPYPEAHFATYPMELVRPCVLAGTSAKGCCSKCGAPWAREVEKGDPDAEHRAACGADSTGGYHGAATKDYRAARAQDPSAVKARILDGMRERRSTWRPGCDCVGASVPCTVLDPFSGSGTTGVVARRLGRHYIGIELNEEYLAMSRRRIQGDMPLFNGVADA